MLAISSPYKLWRVLTSIILHIYPLIRVLSPHPCFMPSSVPYPCHPYPYPSFIPTFSIPCNAELTAWLIVSVDRDARFCALELDVLLVILPVDANSRLFPPKLIKPSGQFTP